MHHPVKQQTCPKGHPRQYSDKHDAYYCDVCDIWLEGKCDDELCYFCVVRPKKPYADL